MDEMDRKIRDSLNKKPTEQYNQMIKETLNLIENEKIEKENSNVVEFKSKFLNKGFKRIVQNIAAVTIIGVLGVTTYAGVTGKIDINIGNTGHSKIDKNYNDVATAVDKVIDNEYFTFSLNSMAADPAYLIFEYSLKLKETGIEKIGEVKYDEFDRYQIQLQSQTFVNDKELTYQSGNNLRNIEKISDKEFKIVELYPIANIKSNELKVKKRIDNIIFYNYEIVNNYSNYKIKLNVDINQELIANVKFKNNETKILAQTELNDGRTLYIEEVANSKFENFVLARVVTKPVPKSEIFPNEKSEFMFDISDFAICNQNDENINYDSYELEEYYEKVLPNGTVEVSDFLNLEDTDMVRVQNVKLLRLGFDDSNIPEKLKILPISRKLYNDRNNSEYKFYMNEDWYQVKVGEVNITENSQVGGSVTVTKIEETDDNIIFYYDKRGYVPQAIYFSLRVKSSKMNEYSPRTEKFKGIDGEENKIIYTKDTAMLAGIHLLNYPRFDNLDDLEFALFYNNKCDRLSEPLEFDWNNTESEEIAEIEKIEFSKYVVDINEKLEKSIEEKHILDRYKGVITEINSKQLKFFSEEEQKELILSNPSSFKYVNGRTDEDLDFAQINVGDIFWTNNYGNIKRASVLEGNMEVFDKITIMRNLSGENLKKELLKNMSKVVYYSFDNYVYRELKDIEFIDDNKAIITMEFSDPYASFVTENNEKFTCKFEVNNDTVIDKYINSLYFDNEYYNISDLKTLEYVSTRVNIIIDKNTVNDEIPIVTEMAMGYLD